MMEINFFSFKKLNNAEHFQFHTDFRNLIIKATSATLGIESQYSAFLIHYANEDEALNIVRKNSVYEQLVAADLVRDSTFRGLSYLIKSSCYHFTPAIKQAALRVKIVFDQNKTLVTKSFNQETASINNLISRLNRDFATDLITLGITDWLTHLQTENTAFDTLMSGRHSEEASKTQLRMRQVRLEIDAAYRQVTKRINALIEINGEEPYKVFVDELNQRIDFYGNNAAIRSGQKAKDAQPPASEN
jgi:hypothetical protein